MHFCRQRRSSPSLKRLCFPLCAHSVLHCGSAARSWAFVTFESTAAMTQCMTNGVAVRPTCSSSKTALRPLSFLLPIVFNGMVSTAMFRLQVFDNGLGRDVALWMNLPQVRDAHSTFPLTLCKALLARHDSLVPQNLSADHRTGPGRGGGVGEAAQQGE